MDPAFKVPVTGQHAGDQQIIVVDGVTDFLLQRTGVADTGGAAEADNVEAERIKRILQTGFLQIISNDLRARLQAGSDPRLYRHALGQRIARNQTSGNQY